MINQTSRIKAYEEYKKGQLELKEIPFNYECNYTLELIKTKYTLLKNYHNELPKLKKRTFILMNGKCKDSRIAHSHKTKKRVCFNSRFLRRIAYINKVNDLGKWRILKGTLAIIELLTHEITHWKIKGVHNKRFYNTQKRYLNTLINLVISGEYYTGVKAN